MPDEQQRRRCPSRGGRASAMPRERDRAGEAVEQRDAEEEERRGERAEQEVLQRRLLATAAGGAGPARTAGTAAARAPRARRTWSAGRWPRGRASCRRARTASAGRPRSASTLLDGELALVGRCRAAPAACGGERVARRRRPSRSAISSSAAAARAAASCPAGTAPGRRRRPRPAPRCGLRRRRCTTTTATKRGDHEPPRAQRPAARCGGAARGTNASTRTPSTAAAEHDQHRREAGVLDRRGREVRASITARRQQALIGGPSPAAPTGAVAAGRSADVLHRRVDRRVDDVEHRLREEAEQRGSARSAARPPRASRGRRGP